MAELRPAWSEQFDAGTLQPVPVRLPERPTKDWAWGDSTGEGINVAVIDSGVDGDHPDVGGIAGAVALEFDPDAEDYVRAHEGQHEDLYGHGTACAAIIRKVAPAASIYSVRVLGERLTGKGIVFAAGLRWAIDNGMHVANLSLSTGKQDYYGMFHEIADDAYFRNLMLVCAVNNVPTPSFPSLYSSVFSVAAHGRTDPFGFDYNPSPPVEFGAPGIDIEVAWQDKSHIVATGNSFAAPHIAGIVARIMGKHPGLTPFQMKTLLAALADNAT